MSSYNLTHLKELESEAIYILREVAAQFEKPIMLFSGGKDSIIMFHLARKAFHPGKVPFPLMHVDTGHNFPETIEFRDRLMEETGETLPYALFVPSKYKEGKKTSLVVSLHGLTRTYDWLMGYEGLLDLAEELDFIVVTPLGYTRNGWYGAWSTGLDERSLEKEGLYSEKDVMNVLELVKQNYTIDQKNIFLWGHSMGGAGTYHLGMKYPNLWKALALAAPAPPQTRKVEDLKIIPTKQTHTLLELNHETADKQAI